MSWILAIDTSDASAFAALHKQGTDMFYEAGCAVANSHNEVLAGLVAQLLAEAGIVPRDLALLICGSGPGSFTGLRIGLSFAKGLALALRSPLIMAPSLKACAWEFRDRKDLLLALYDARRAEFFSALYVRQAGGGLAERLAPGIRSAAQMDGEIEKCLAQTGLSRERAGAVAGAGHVFAPGLWGLAVFNPSHVARSLIEISMLERGAVSSDKHESSASSALELSRAIPDYLRPVAARTIAERQGAALLLGRGASKGY